MPTGGVVTRYSFSVYPAALNALTLRLYFLPADSPPTANVLFGRILLPTLNKQQTNF